MPAEFETYTVKVRVETSVQRDDDRDVYWLTQATGATGLVAAKLYAGPMPEARANHAVACADAGLPNVWPVSEGDLRIYIQRWPDSRVLTTYVTALPEALRVVASYDWPTEAEATEGHKAVARRWGAPVTRRAAHDANAQGGKR